MRRWFGYILICRFVPPLMLAAALGVAGTAFAQNAGRADDPGSVETSIPSEPLVVRQADIRDRLRRLEDRLLALAQLLAEREPEQAARLTDALDHAGRRQIRQLVDDAVARLDQQRFDEADQTQQRVLADLQAMLAILNEPESRLQALEDRQAELGELLGDLQTLIDEQRGGRDELDRRIAAGEVEFGDLARAQEQTHKKADSLHQAMDSDGEVAKPGSDAVGEAAEHMRQAAEQLADNQPADAHERQEVALAELERAARELEDALARLEREQREQLLTEVIEGLENLLARERQVRTVVEELAAREGEWDQTSAARLATAATTQSGVADDAEHVAGLLRDDGSTRVLPVMVGQIARDAHAAAQRLHDADTSAATRRLVADIVAQLESVLASVQTRRRNPPQTEAAPQETSESGRQQTPPLLPNSAELRLLRGAQVRINERTTALAEQPADAPAELEALSRRQRELAELTRAMIERN